MASTYTAATFPRQCFPNTLLGRLEKTLCDRLGLTGDHQHILRKDEHNPLIGSIELVKPRWAHEIPIYNTIKEFYILEGFKENQDGSFSKEGESYISSVLNLEDSWQILIQQKK